METERWQRIEAVFHAALAREASGRDEFVRQECGGDEELRKEVLSLLAESEADEDFLEDPAMHVAARVLASSSKAEGENAAAGSLPPFIGRYRVIRLLGEGGMGTVYEAEQDEPRRVVALKVIRPGLATPERLRRFRHEAQALGRLQHAGIAQIYDAGAADTGFGPQPYFAMELVRGESLDRYVATHPLSTREKLALMAKICEGVHHAHQRGLIHRDLKPGNILIDETGQPKILDFGVARLTESEAQLTMQTEVGQIVGTLAYMSPEQVQGDPQEIDTRTDVYSLGVILYELLTGQLPYNVSGRQIPEAVRTIREVDPASLSSISRNYRGDVETIVGKALEKDKARRYESAAALGADIQHYLSDEPILARPPSTSYQLSKFARRHRALVTGAAAVFLVLVVGIAVSTTLAIRARRAEQAAIKERDRASRERDRATRITDFMTGMFKVSDPGESRGNSVTAREILDKASNDLNSGLATDPDAQSQMMQVMANTYANLGLYPRADELATRALEARRKLLGPDDPKTLESMTQVGDILEREGKFEDAEKMERQALAAERRVLGSDDRLTLDTMNLLVITVGFQGRYAEAEKLDREQIEILARKYGPDDDKLVAAKTNLAGLLSAEGRFVEAEKEDRDLSEIARRKWGSDHPKALAPRENLAMVLTQQGRLKEAEQLFREILPMRQRVQGADHPDTLHCMENLAGVLSAEGRLKESEQMYRESLKASVRVLGAEYPETLAEQFDIAVLLNKEGRTQEAEKLAAATLAAQMRILGPDNPDTLSSQSVLVEIMLAQHRYAEAEKMARQVYAVQLRTQGPQHPETMYSLQLLGTSLALDHRYPEAVHLFDGLLEAPGEAGDQENRWRAWYSLACVATAAGRADDAVKYLHDAVNRGYQDADGLMADDDLKTLRQNPHFQDIVATLRRPPKAAQAQ
jgi:non-specific serine/threonine protein kinase/serine/threonine-protein kinase